MPPAGATDARHRQPAMQQPYDFLARRGQWLAAPAGAALALAFAPASLVPPLFTLTSSPALPPSNPTGTCAGFPAGAEDGHQLVNRSDRPVRYLEVSNRDPRDGATYPDDDLVYRKGGDGKPVFTRKDGTSFDG